MRNKKSLLYGIGLLLLIGIIAGIVFHQRSVQDEQGNPPLNIASILSMTGPAAPLGQELKRGHDIAIGYWKQQGIEVELTVEDSKALPATALSAFKSLQARGYQLFIANLSGVCLALKPEIDGDNSLLLAVGSHPAISNPAQKGVVLYSQTAEEEASELAKIIKKNFSNETILLVHSDDEYGQGFSKQLSGEVTQPIVRASYSQKDTTAMRDIVQPRLPEMKYLPVVVGSGQPMAQAIRVIRELGYSGPILVNIGYAVTGVKNMLGEDAGRIIYTELDVLETSFTRFTKKQYEEIYNRSITAEALAGANAIAVFVEAMKAAESTNARDISSVIARVGKEATGNVDAGRPNEIVIGVSVREN